MTKKIVEKLRSMMRDFIGVHHHGGGPTVVIPIVATPDTSCLTEEERLAFAKAQVRAAQEILIRADINVTFGPEVGFSQGGAGGRGGPGGPGSRGGRGGAGGQGGSGGSAED